jgi:hypothetical protein
VFETGALLCKVHVPGEQVELTQILHCKQCDKWCSAIIKTICEQLTPEQELCPGIDLNSINFFPKANIITITTGSITIRLSPNNTSSFFIAAILEEFNARIGQKNLLKRSLLLIKNWCVHESARNGPKGML